MLTVDKISRHGAVFCRARNNASLFLFVCLYRLLQVDLLAIALFVVQFGLDAFEFAGAFRNLPHFSAFFLAPSFEVNSAATLFTQLPFNEIVLTHYITF